MIYVITRGDYSDYTIWAATTDKDRAEKLKRIYTTANEEAYIEMFEDGKAPGIDEAKIIYPWCVRLIKKIKPVSDVQIIKVSQYTYSLVGDKPYETEIYTNVDRDYFYMAICLLAEDEDHAIKIAYDKFAQWMAEINGI